MTQGLRGTFELFYRSPEAVMVVPVELGETFPAHELPALFGDQYGRDFPTWAFDVHPNGDTFVMVRSTSTELQLVVVIGWLEDLRGRASSHRYSGGGRWRLFKTGVSDRGTGRKNSPKLTPNAAKIADSASTVTPLSHLLRGTPQ